LGINILSLKSFSSMLVMSPLRQV